MALSKLEDKAMKKPTKSKAVKSKAKKSKAAAPVKIKDLSEVEFWRGMCGEMKPTTVEDFDRQLGEAGGAAALIADPAKFNAFMRQVSDLPALPSERVAEMLQAMRKRLAKAKT